MSNEHASIWPIPCPEPGCPAQVGEPCPGQEFTHLSRVRAIRARTEETAARISSQIYSKRA